jgi:hypothetical protein
VSQSTSENATLRSPSKCQQAKQVGTARHGRRRFLPQPSFEDDSPEVRPRSLNARPTLPTNLWFLLTVIVSPFLGRAGLVAGGWSVRASTCSGNKSERDNSTERRRSRLVPSTTGSIHGLQKHSVSFGAGSAPRTSTVCLAPPWIIAYRLWTGRRPFTWTAPTR